MTIKEFEKLDIRPYEDEIYVRVSKLDSGLYVLCKAKMERRRNRYKLTLKSEFGERHVGLARIKSIVKWNDITTEEQTAIEEMLYDDSDNDNGEHKDRLDCFLTKYMKGKYLSDYDRRDRINKIFLCKSEDSFYDESKQKISRRISKDKCQKSNNQCILQNTAIEYGMCTGCNKEKQCCKLCIAINHFETLERMGTYILGYKYSDRRFKQQYNDERRQFNQDSFTDVIAKSYEYKDHIDIDVIDYKAYQLGYADIFIDEGSVFHYIEAISDELNKLIALADSLYQTKTDVEQYFEREYNLSRQNVRTRRKHIGMELRRAGLYPKED